MSASWIEACRRPVVPGTKIHAAALTPMVLWMVWWSWTTFWIVLIVTIVAVYLQIKGRQLSWVLRRFKAKVRGEVLQARPVWYQRRRTRIESYDLIRLDQPVSRGVRTKASAASTPSGKGSSQ